MIAKIYKLPAWLTSPDDKPDKQLWNELITNTTYYSTIDAQTISAPDLDTITVQTGGLGDMQQQQLYLSNFINVGTFWYQITNISYEQQTASGVYMVEGKLDIYFTFLVNFFDENTTSSNRVYFHQKHLDRQITANTTTGTTITNQGYLWPSIQQYLLMKHPALADIGKQLVKTYHILNPNNYPIPTTTPTITNTSWTTTLNSGPDENNQVYNFKVSITNINGTSYSATNYYGNWEYGSTNFVSNAYPVLVLKADIDSIKNAYYDDTPEYLFPYYLCDWGQTWDTSEIPTSTLTVSLINNPDNLSPYTTTINYPMNMTSPGYVPLFNIANDYYVGLYLFPLPVNALRHNWIDGTVQGIVVDGPFFTPISNILNQGIFENGKAYSPTVPGTYEAPFGSQEWLNAVGGNISNKISEYALANLVCDYVRGNTFYAVPKSTLTPINNLYIANNLSIIEPALLNWMEFNVRMYGQDNLVRPLDFNYTLSYISTDLSTGAITTTICTSMNALYCYLNYFAITISPPNVMITNIPYHDLEPNIFGSSGVPNWFPKFWAFNGYNDAIFSAMMKSEVPTPSTAWSNYIANSKNSYDMGLNISNLLAQNAQAQVQIAKNSMGQAIASEIGGIGGVIGDVFSGQWGKVGSAIGGIASGAVGIASASIDANTIAPNNADIQEMKYRYEATGKAQDMSRTTSMRVSATATTNTLNDTVYTVVDELPPLYEQVYVVNYYALDGYIVNKWDLWKYWFNRNICNFVRCAFFTNAMLPNLNINWKAKVDELLNKGFRVWCYNNNQSVQINPTTTSKINWNTIPYNVVLYNSFENGDYIYNNTEVNSDNGTAEIYYLYNGKEASGEDVQAWVSSFSTSKGNQTNEIIYPYKNCSKN